ncbi:MULTISPECIES: hypothetical protein [Aminobacterium]|jgi:hypothetical protein|uniref:hypothetical protein n=1 Tax=Aminobacterium TaxID=81466 RepID=UPI00257B2CA6|nr:MULTISPECIES: hypothetical protein [unclassified Aminobacterium]
MCKVITPEATEGHVHVHGALEEAELLRETISEELDSITSLVARWHAVESVEGKNTFFQAIKAKRTVLKRLWEALTEMEESFLLEGCEEAHCHHHH